MSHAPACGREREFIRARSAASPSRYSRRSCSSRIPADSSLCRTGVAGLTFFFFFFFFFFFSYKYNGRHDGKKFFCRGGHGREENLKNLTAVKFCIDHGREIFPRFLLVSSFLTGPTPFPIPPKSFLGG